MNQITSIAEAETALEAGDPDSIDAVREFANSALRDSDGYEALDYKYLRLLKQADRAAGANIRGLFGKPND